MKIQVRSLDHIKFHSILSVWVVIKVYLDEIQKLTKQKSSQKSSWWDNHVTAQVQERQANNKRLIANMYQ